MYHVDDVCMILSYVLPFQPGLQNVRTSGNRTVRNEPDNLVAYYIT